MCVSTVPRSHCFEVSLFFQGTWQILLSSFTLINIRQIISFCMYFNFMCWHMIDNSFCMYFSISHSQICEVLNCCFARQHKIVVISTVADICIINVKLYPPLFSCLFVYTITSFYCLIIV